MVGVITMSEAMLNGLPFSAYSNSSGSILVDAGVAQVSDTSGNHFGDPAMRRENRCGVFALMIGAGTSLSDFKCETASSA